ncbi:MAG: hypothetical protein ACRD2S_07925 [Terriglobales bacterium]
MLLAPGIMNDASVTTADDSVVVEIGGTAIALQTESCSLQRLFRDRYSPFLTTSRKAHSRFKLELIEPPADIDEDQDLQVKMDGGRWTFLRNDFDAVWDPGTGLGNIRQSANPYSPDTVLRIVHSLILAREGGFLLHAASAVRDGSAFLFAGVSGAGKTTISRLAPSDVTLLTDEISYVKPDGTGYRAFGTPFAGELSKPGKNVSAPIATLFLLVQGPENRIVTVSPDEATRLLLRNILFFAEDSELVNLVFQSACNFLEKVPVRKLVFVPDERIWETIRPPGN